MAIAPRTTRRISFLYLCSFMVFLGQGLVIAKDNSPSRKEPVVETAKSSRVKLGHFSAGVGYRRYSWYDGYRFWSPYYSGSFYPFLFPYYHPGYFYGAFYPELFRQESMGEIKLRTNINKADVFIEEAWAGKAEDLKTIRLPPGVYNLRIESENYTPFQIRLYVLSGKTLKVNANLVSVTEARKP